jgi:nucleoside-diphosphate-sugar epimerase
MPVVPPKGLILVTGANGFVASAAVKVFLERGYSVRGTVRSVAKHQLSYFGPNFSLAEVPDMNADGAFDEAIKGVDGVAHIAANVSLTVNPAIIDEAAKSILNIFNAATKEPSVKRIVTTSTRGACMKHVPGQAYKLTPDSWNEAAAEAIKKPFDPAKDMDRIQERTIDIYGVAKMTAEKVALQWVKEHKPSFVFNIVVANVNFGTVPAVEHLGFGSSSSLIKYVCEGIPFGAMMMPAMWYVDVEDDALLHLAALTLEEVQNERILAFAGPYSWNDIIAIIKRRYPDRKSILPSWDEPQDNGEVDNKRAVELLQKMGQKGFKTLEEAVVSNMESVIGAESLPSLPRSKADELLDQVKRQAAAAAKAKAAASS